MQAKLEVLVGDVMLGKVQGLSRAAVLVVCVWNGEAASAGKEGLVLNTLTPDLCAIFLSPSL